MPFFRITPPKHELRSDVIPSSRYLNLAEISHVEEVRRREGEGNAVTIKVWMRDGHQETFSEENTSKTTIKAFLDYLENECLNPKRGEKPEEKKTAAA